MTEGLALEDEHEREIPKGNEALDLKGDLNLSEVS